MWDKDYYHDNALYGQGTALINQARRDAQKLKASNQSSYVRPAPRPRAVGGNGNVKDKLLLGIFIVICAALIPIFQWYTSDSRNYIATGAIIAPLVAVWIRRRLQTRLPMLPEMLSVASLAVVYIYVCDDCLLATDKILGFAYLPAMGTLIGCSIFLIAKRLDRSTGFADFGVGHALWQSFLIAFTISCLPVIVDGGIMGLLTWFGAMESYELFMKTQGATEGHLTRLVVGMYFVVASFGVCEARKRRSKKSK